MMLVCLRMPGPVVHLVQQQRMVPVLANLVHAGLCGNQVGHA